MANRSKAKGTEFESSLVKQLAALTGRKVRRLTLHGNKDIGDLEVHGWDCTIEAKAPGAGKPLSLSAWQRETETERVNGGARWSALIVRHPGYPNDPYVIVPITQFVALMEFYEAMRP